MRNVWASTNQFRKKNWFFGVLVLVKKICEISLGVCTFAGFRKVSSSFAIAYSRGTDRKEYFGIAILRTFVVIFSC